LQAERNHPDIKIGAQKSAAFGEVSPQQTVYATGQRVVGAHAFGEVSPQQTYQVKNKTLSPVELAKTSKALHNNANRDLGVAHEDSASRVSRVSRGSIPIVSEKDNESASQHPNSRHLRQEQRSEKSHQSATRKEVSTFSTSQK
jgi:hypothetical protein